MKKNPYNGAFICAALYGERKDRHGKIHRIEKYFDNLTDLEDYLLSFKTGKNIPFWLIVFNFSYDLILKNIIDDITFLYKRSYFITARLKNNIKVIDLCNHVGGSLKDWIKYLDMKNKYGIKERSLSNPKNRVMNDAKATYYLGRFIEDFYVKELGIKMGSKMSPTASPCSFAIEKKRELNEILWELVKERKITNDKVLKLLDVYSRKSLLLEDDVQHLYDGLTRDRRADRTYQNILKAMWVRYYGRQRSRSGYGKWRREITSKHIDIGQKRCDLCGRRRKLVRHHIHPIGKGGAHVPENMMALCRNCHRLIHMEKGYRKAVKASGLFKEAMKKLYKLRQCAKAEGVRAGKRALKELAKLRP